MTIFDKIVLTIIAGLTVLSAALWATSPEPGPVQDPLIRAAIEQGYVPCEDESDPKPCYWDAAARGNGQGTSFVWTGDEMFYGTDN